MPEKRALIMHMLVPGRRAFGEGWSKVSIYANPETGSYDTEREDATAPAEDCAIFIPAMGNESVEAADYLLEYKKKDQEYRKAHNLPIKRGYSYEEINKLWQDWMELKIKRFKGQTQSGPAATFQREKGR